MEFTMSSSRRQQDAIDRLYEAGYNAHAAPARMGAPITVRLDVDGAQAESEVTEIVMSVDAGAKRVQYGEQSQG